MLRMLTHRCSEYCGNRESHKFASYLDLENIQHTRTKARSPQTNGICERFHRTIQDEFYATAFRRKLYHSPNELQADVDAWMEAYNAERTRAGKYCRGKTPLQTFIESATPAYDKQPDRTMPTSEPATAAA
jgi:hypothetical protein